MDNKEQAKMTRLNTTTTYLAEPTIAAMYATDNAFKAMVAKIVSSQTEVAALAAKTGADNSGYSQQKMNAKLDMSFDAAVYSGNAYVHFEEAGKHDLSSQCHINSSDYSSLADSAAAALAQEAHDFLNSHIAELSPDSVTAANLTDLQAKINTFIATQGTSGVVHQVSAADTAAFKAALAVADDRIAKLLILAKKYKKSNANFYDKLILATTLPPVNIHHTNLIVTVVNATTKVAVAGATIAIEGSIKTATTDVNGIAKLEKIKAGNSNVTIAAAGLTAKTIIIAVQRGKDNAINVELN